MKKLGEEDSITIAPSYHISGSFFPRTSRSPNAKPQNYFTPIIFLPSNFFTFLFFCLPIFLPIFLPSYFFASLFFCLPIFLPIFFPSNFFAPILPPSLYVPVPAGGFFRIPSTIFPGWPSSRFPTPPGLANTSLLGSSPNKYISVAW